MVDIVHSVHGMVMAMVLLTLLEQGCGVAFGQKLKQKLKSDNSILPKSGIVPQDFHFIPKVITYCIPSNLLQEIPTQGKILLDRISATLIFFGFFFMYFLCTEIGL